HTVVSWYAWDGEGVVVTAHTMHHERYRSGCPCVGRRPGARHNGLSGVLERARADERPSQLHLLSVWPCSRGGRLLLLLGRCPRSRLCPAPLPSELGRGVYARANRALAR